MEKRPSFAILAVLAILTIGLVSVLLARGQQPKVQAPNSQGTSNALIAVKANSANETTVGSPDGKWSLKMREERGKEDITYTFSVLSSADGSQKEIFRKNVPIGATMAIPPNTFSPDGKYLFLKETEGDLNIYLVLSSTGASLTKDGSTLEISSLFAAKYPDYKITDVTGWGGVGLVVFNVDKKTGGAGPSFWFEVPSGGFIQLSNRFN